ncbi:hypothetical protein CBR_g29658 [Chara braunii]|uniref:Uncharacterized protein n=1 Tax=Chara braunii TaxID=69332 RepID=A0A388LB21_CHABU|nr:hypothetical protein CBR_g29658 [Chara braunii]|eukprot:GBG79511.1 hypothetical protein CBR_g29658 [Chara braunii]
MEEPEDTREVRQSARSPPVGPSEQLNYWDDEERIRTLLGLCFDDEVYPTDLGPGEMTVQGREVKFKLNTTLDEIKVKWLKELTVSVIFKKNARFLPKRVKDDVIQAFEDGWVLGNDNFPTETRRGRIKIEGPNALSYVAKSREVAAYMIHEGGVKIPVGATRYKVQFKPWMTKAEFKELRRQEDDRTFWVIAIQVPLDNMPFIFSQIQRAIGRSILAHPPDVDPSRPSLVNVRFDIDPEARGNMKDKLWINTSNEDELEVKLACATTPKYQLCKQFFHVAEECRRNGGGQTPGAGVSFSVPHQQPAQSGTGQRRSRRPSYQGTLEPQPSQGPSMGGGGPAGFSNATLNPIFSPRGQAQPDGYLNMSSSMANLFQAATNLYGIPQQGGFPPFGGNWLNQNHPLVMGGGFPPPPGGDLGGVGAYGASTFRSYQPGAYAGGPQPAPGPGGRVGRPEETSGQSHNTPVSTPTRRADEERRGTNGGEDGAESQGASTSRTEDESRQRTRPSGKQRKLSMSSVTELRVEQSGGSSTHSSDCSATPGMKTTRDRRLTSVARGQSSGMEQVLLSLVCTYARNAYWAIAWQTQTTPFTLLSQPVVDAPSVQAIGQALKMLYLEYFPVRVIPDCPMARIITDTGGHKLKLFVPIVDSRFTPDRLLHLERAGLRLIPLASFAEGRK